MRCPNCKTELKQDDIYCYQCGTRINWFWRYKIHLIVAVAVIVFFAIGGTTVFTLYKNGVFDGKKEVAVVQKEEKDTVATGESSSENNPAQPPQEADA
ncbi:MAG: zinc ribbon domain-containing protein, partial [Eubacterium sp.]|nr:zinc ribbon domain-containing protein [Eubacterium sp.]